MRFSSYAPLGCLVLVSCVGDRVPVPPLARDAQPGSHVVVTHPPPAALPEIVPDAPNKEARWLDGYWIFRAGNWVWVRGGWVEVPPGVSLVPSRFSIEENGVLEFCERRWIDERGRTVEGPEIVKPADTPPTPILPEDATLP